MSQKTIKFSTLSDILIEHDDKNVLYEYIQTSFNLSTTAFELYRRQVDQFIKNHNFRWKKKSTFRKNHFQKHYKAWLRQKFCLNDVALEPSHEKQIKAFQDCSDQTRKNRVEQLLQDKSFEEIELAYIEALRKRNKIDAKIVKQLSTVSDVVKYRILETLRKESNEITPYTPNEALALLIDAKLSKYQYELLHHEAKLRNADIYPIYNKILDAKKNCYPPCEQIQISDYGVQINLQALLDHTGERLIRICSPTVLSINNRTQLKLLTKWGMDGASGQSSYKQVFKNDSGDSSDSSIFMMSLVPLQIRSSDTILWSNPRPSSNKLCRPIQFDFTKECREVSIGHRDRIQEQINQLHPTILNVSGRKFRMVHSLSLTMVDGKTVNYFTDTSSSNCNICGAKPTEMNNLVKVKAKLSNNENFQYGLSTLHCWIRFLECILHIAYKLSIKKWKTNGIEDEAKVKQLKEGIQLAFKTTKGLKIDVVRPGSGTSNDGNTARRFFEDPEFASETTGVNENLIRRFGVILVTLSSGMHIDIEKFQQYASDTAEIYVSTYPWYYMPPTVHKILFHAGDVINSFDLPIGAYSEEAQEARNKDFKRIRENNTRKDSRQHTNEDIIHGLLVSSDPVISSLRNKFKTKTKEFDPAVLELFLND